MNFSSIACFIPHVLQGDSSSASRDGSAWGWGLSAPSAVPWTLPGMGTPPPQGSTKGIFNFFSLVLSRIPLPTENLSSFKRSGLKFSFPDTEMLKWLWAMLIKLLCILLDFNTRVLYKMRSGGEDLMVCVCSDARGCPELPPCSLLCPHTWFYTVNCSYVLPATFLPCQESSLWSPSSGVSSSAGSGNGASFPSQKSRLFSRICGFFIPIFPFGLLNINKSAVQVSEVLSALLSHSCSKETFVHQNYKICGVPFSSLCGVPFSWFLLHEQSPVKKGQCRCN